MVTRTLTWADLAIAEPRLATLLTEARAVRPGRSRVFCANALWYDRFKPRLMRLVGWERGDNALLGTTAAYDLAYQTIYGALPNCRGACRCVDYGAIA